MREHRKQKLAKKSQQEAVPPEQILPTPEKEVHTPSTALVLEQKQGALATNQTELQELAALNMKLEEAITPLQTKLAAWQSKQKEYEQAVRQLENHIRFLNDQSTAIDPKNPSVLNLLGSASELVKSIQLPSLQEKLAKERDHLKNARQNIDSINSKLAELKGKRSRISEAMEQKKTECAKLDAEIGTLAEKVAPED